MQDPTRPEAAIPYKVRLALTILLMGMYLAAHRLPLPFAEPGQLPPSMPVKTFSIMALGLKPLLTGFLLVELFSLLAPPGRRLRQGGIAGRAKLNRAALAVSLLVSGFQALGITQYLEAVSRISGGSFGAHPDWIVRILLVMTLAAVTAAVFTLGNIVSEFGIGNGFALLILAETGMSVSNPGLRAIGDPSLLPLQGLGLLLLAGVAVPLARYIRRAQTRWIPAFPQGILPVQWMSIALALSATIPIFLDGSSATRTPAIDLTMILFGIPLLSWLTFHLFSSRARLAANLPESDEVVDRLAITLRRRLVDSTVLLTLGTAALLAWSYYQPVTLTAPVGFLELTLIVAIGLDLRDQFSFSRRHVRGVRLAQLDNVHFAYRLAERLNEGKIDFLARALHLRALYFFFGPLIKIDVLVPPEQIAQAREVLRTMEFARELEAF